MVQVRTLDDTKSRIERQLGVMSFTAFSIIRAQVTTANLSSSRDVRTNETLDASGVFNAESFALQSASLCSCLRCRRYERHFRTSKALISKEGPL